MFIIAHRLLSHLPAPQYSSILTLSGFLSYGKYVPVFSPLSFLFPSALCFLLNFLIPLKHSPHLLQPGNPPFSSTLSLGRRSKSIEEDVRSWGLHLLQWVWGCYFMGKTYDLLRTYVHVNMHFAKMKS